MSTQFIDGSQSPLSRIAAPTALLAGALVAVTRTVILLTTPTELDAFTDYVLSPLHAVNSVLSIVAFALLVLALVAAYERIARPAGMLGLIGLAAAIVGTVFMAGDWWYEAFAVPRIAEVAPEAIETFVGGRLLIGGLSSFALFGIGWVMFGVASIRAHVYPRAISIAILVGGLLSGVPVAIVYLPGGVIHGMAFMWLGAWMVMATRPAPSAAGEPAPAQ